MSDLSKLTLDSMAGCAVALRGLGVAAPSLENIPNVDISLLMVVLQLAGDRVRA